MRSEKTLKVGFVVVNFNGESYLKRCLDSIFNQTFKNLKVVLVDNGSTDGSREFVKTKFPKVEIIENEKNLGFAQGNNIGIDLLLSKDLDIKYVALLNTDAYLKNTWLEQIIHIVEKHSEIGSCTGKVLNANDPTLVDSAGIFLKGFCRMVKRGFREKDESQYQKEAEIFISEATAVVYRRKMLEEVRENGDYFDSDFFAYGEDADLDLRARLLGWQCFYTPQAVAYHFFATTSRKMYSGFREYHAKRNRVWVIIKNYPAFLVPLALLCLLKPAKGGLVSDKNVPLPPLWQNLKIHLKAHFDAVLHLRKMLKKRKQIQKKRVVSDDEIKRWFKELTLNENSFSRSK